jgi:hypothetical protein
MTPPEALDNCRLRHTVPAYQPRSPETAMPRTPLAALSALALAVLPSAVSAQAAPLTLAMHYN